MTNQLIIWNYNIIKVKNKNVFIHLFVKKNLFIKVVAK